MQYLYTMQILNLTGKLNPSPTANAGIAFQLRIENLTPNIIPVLVLVQEDIGFQTNVPGVTL